MKLWRESFNVLDTEVPTSGRVREEIEKYFVKTTSLGRHKTTVQSLTYIILPPHNIWRTYSTKLLPYKTTGIRAALKQLHLLLLASRRYLKKKELCNIAAL